jgi:hypothetical protein
VSVPKRIWYVAYGSSGLREAHGWSQAQINRYLLALPGTGPDNAPG